MCSMTWRPELEKEFPGISHRASLSRPRQLFPPGTTHIMKCMQPRLLPRGNGPAPLELMAGQEDR